MKEGTDGGRCWDGLVQLEIKEDRRLARTIQSNHDNLAFTLAVKVASVESGEL